MSESHSAMIGVGEWALWTALIMTACALLLIIAGRIARRRERDRARRR